MLHINLLSKRTINKKVTILGSSGTPEKGNLIKHIQDDATLVQQRNALLYSYTLQPVSTVIGELFFQIFKRRVALQLAKSSSRHHSDLMSCQQIPFQRTMLRLTMPLLSFPRGGMVVDRLLVTRSWDCLHHPPASLSLNVVLLLLFPSWMKIFSWRCDTQFQGEMRRGNGVTELSGATIADYSQL